ncbi:MAG: YceI family protein [Myxococcota bacterium]
MFLALALVTVAPAQTIDGKPRVVFHAEGSPGFLTFEGVTRQLTLEADGDTLTFIVPMDTVQTGIALRDQHMRDTYVETATFPDVALTVRRADVRFPEAGQRHEGTLSGTFTAHGVTRDVAVAYTIREKKGRFTIEASFPFDTSAHDIAIPSYLGVTIRSAMRAEVDVTIVP